jgi:amino acid transporter
MVGGGFYALVGKVAGLAGLLAPVAVLLAALVALLSACSFAELSSRYPFSAGEARYVEEAFGRAWLAVLVGWLVIATGVVSTATLANAIVLFVGDHWALPRGPAIAGVVLALGLLAAWGIAESVLAAIAITVIEVGGLVYVLGVLGGSYAELPGRLHELLPGASLAQWSAIILAAFLIFYAFIGFEDMVNVAEEVVEPRRVLPTGILLALGLTALLYLLVVVALVLAVPLESLAGSGTPLAVAVASRGPFPVAAMSAISTLAGVNGALVQVIMASRVAYGLSDRGLGPAWLARVARATRTPVPATAFVTLIVLALALWLPLVPLAKLTSAIILLVFAIVNLALWILKGRPTREDATASGAVRFPRWLPLVGAISCLAILLLQLFAGATSPPKGPGGV